jgi:hypothetical protein
MKVTKELNAGTSVMFASSVFPRDLSRACFRRSATVDASMPITLLAGDEVSSDAARRVQNMPGVLAGASG